MYLTSLRMTLNYKTYLCIAFFSFHWPQCNAVVDGRCLCARAVHGSMWSVHHMACLPSGQCSCLLGASWLEGCGHEILRVVSVGKFLASTLLKLKSGNQVPSLDKSEEFSLIPINQSEDCASADDCFGSFFRQLLPCIV